MRWLKCVTANIVLVTVFATAMPRSNANDAMLALESAILGAAGGFGANREPDDDRNTDDDDKDNEDEKDEDGEERASGGGGGRISNPWENDHDVRAVLMQRARFLLFSTSEVWWHGGFTHAGVLMAPHGVDRDGPQLKLIFGAGVYRYTSAALGNFDVLGEQLSAGLMPGWRFMLGKFTVTVFGGVDYQRNWSLPRDPGMRLRGPSIGPRGALDIWFQPTARTMVTAELAATSIGSSYSARLAGGLKLFDWFYLGPEFAGFSTGGAYRQWRAGGHVTGLRFGQYDWSVGAGYSRDNTGRYGVYGRLGISARH